MIDPTNTKPLPMHAPLSVKRVAVFVVLAILLSGALGVVYFRKLANENEPPTPPPAEEPAPVTQFFGRVKSVSGDTLIFEVSYPNDSTLDASLNERTVRISEGVKIERIIRHSPEVVAKNMEKFLEAMAEYEEKVSKVSPDDTTPFLEMPPEYPRTFDRESVGADALQAGQQIMLTTKEDARTLREITPAAIEIIPPLTEPILP